ELEIIFRTRLNNLELAAALRNDVRKREPERRGGQDLFIADGIEDVVKSLRSAISDDDAALFGVAIILGDLLTQGTEPNRRRIREFVFSGFDRFNNRFSHLGVHRKFRRTCVECYSTGAEEFCAFRGLQTRKELGGGL